MSNLRQLQLQLFQTITKGGNRLASQLSSPSTRTDIYQQSCRQAQIQALCNRHPLTQQLLGETYFRQLAAAFCERHTPASNNLHSYGDELPAVIAQLASEKPFRALRDIGYLAEILRLDQSLHDAYYAPDSHPWKPEYFAQLTAAQQQSYPLCLQSAASLLSSHWPLINIRDSILQNKSLQLSQPTDQEHYFLVYRPQFHGQLQSLTKAQFSALQSLLIPMRLDHWVARHPSAQEFVADWISSGIVTPGEAME